MRSGYYKETVAELIVLSDSKPVWFWTGVLLLGLAALPLFASPYLLGHVTLILFTLVGVLGLHLLTGYTGIISLGHVAFLMLGAYGYAISTTRYGLHPVLGFLAAGAAAAVAGLIVGGPSLRLKGLYLTITTLAFAFITGTLVIEAEGLTGGAMGIPLDPVVIFGVDFSSPKTFYWLCLFVAVVTMLVTLNIKRSRVGRAFMAIRDNDIAARAMGISLTYYKLLAFVASSFITGIAGALMAVYLSYVQVEGFPFLLSIEALAILIVGGLGSALGAVLGTVFIITLPEVVSAVFGLLGSDFEQAFVRYSYQVKSIIYGLVIILFLRFYPEGLVKLWKDTKQVWVNWPLRY